MFDECFDVSSSRQIGEFGRNSPSNLFVDLSVQLAKLPQCFGMPVDRVHTGIISEQYVLSISEPDAESGEAGSVTANV